jgi:hypothetical protein
MGGTEPGPPATPYPIEIIYPSSLFAITTRWIWLVPS